MAEAAGIDKMNANDDAAHVLQLVQTTDTASKSSQSDIQVNSWSNPTSTKKTGNLLTDIFKKKRGRKRKKNKETIVGQKKNKIYKMKGIIMKWHKSQMTKKNLKDTKMTKALRITLILIKKLTLQMRVQ